ncbi:Predicted dehydrogenase [Granulicatella balaenopterae]|uniref:Predicted dehydrogenase n=1 Tax=Granulicatella balaenopterae TaxID=137733 RepID=A0A1H9GYB6_9LACT|nr:Gfo/Idh/MocA family oxidoreductase [Granulicatella balaenopterae]SEQ55069.1 Predicted dehydrogenase [Granulicatella balaenopterae]
MLRIAIMGTSWISKDFVAAVQLSELYQVEAVISRTQEKADQFAEEFAIPEALTYDSVDLHELAVDVVYLGTPNAIHFQQAKDCLKAKKHLIVEKPAFDNLAQWQEVHQLAKELGLFVFEAARHYHEDNFKIVKQWVDANQSAINGVNLSFAKYSSKYDRFLQGDIAPVFTKEYSGGALVDLGIYPLYASIAWFGEPQAVQYFAQMLPTGVDGNGVAILRYQDFDVTIHTGKNITSSQPCEIYAGKETLELNGINIISEIKLVQSGEVMRDLALPTAEHYLLDEVMYFAEVMMHPHDSLWLEEYQEWTSISQLVAKVSEQLRQTAGIKFTSEEGI